MKKRGLTLVEIILTFVIVSSLIGIGSLYFKSVLRAFREVALKNQLVDIRLSLKLYQLLHDKNPQDLRTLLTEEVNFMPYSGGLFKKRYLESVRSDKDNFPLDPFGNRFVYRPYIGEVRSSTKGYEAW